MIYLFHNIYGDAQELIASAPSNCQIVPFGWTEEIEETRNAILNQLNVAVSSLPSVVYFQSAYTLTIVDSTANTTETKNLGNCWQAINVQAMNKPWNWTDIQAEIDRDKNTTVTVSESAT